MLDSVQIVHYLVQSFLNPDYRLTPQAQQVTMCAEGVAKKMNSIFIRDIHLLLGWLNIYSQFCPSCEKFGLSYREIFNRLNKKDTKTLPNAFYGTQYSLSYRRIIVSSYKDSRGMGQGYVGGHNILHGLVADNSVWNYVGIGTDKLSEWNKEVYEELLIFWGYQREQHDTSNEE